MARIALAWELGANFGHVANLIALAERLQARGHEPVYLLRDTAGSSVLTGPVLQAPVWLKETRGFAEPPLNYTEMLLRYGYHDAVHLAELADAWCQSLRMARIDAVVAEHAPTALLAARLLDLPAAMLGAGFMLPPMQSPMPNMRHWIAVPQDRLINSDQLVLAQINRVLEARGKPALSSVSDLLAVPARFLNMFAELDHYRDRRGEHYLGPIFEANSGADAVWPAQGGKRVFVYLRPGHRDFARLMELLGALQASVLVCAPGITETQQKAFETSNLAITSRKLRISSINGCDMALTYGSPGVGAAMLLAGIPMLMLPMHLEQFLFALRVQELGAGVAVNPDSPPATYLPLLQELLNNPSYGESARRFAAKYADFDQNRMLDQMTDRIIELAGGNA